MSKISFQVGKYCVFENDSKSITVAVACIHGLSRLKQLNQHELHLRLQQFLVCPRTHTKYKIKK